MRLWTVAEMRGKMCCEMIKHIIISSAGVKEEIDALINQMAELSKAGKFDEMMQFYADDFRFGCSPTGWICSDKSSAFISRGNAL